MMRILLLGHGRMGQLVESLAASYGATIAGVIDEHSGEDALSKSDFGAVDVAIDFTLADAVPKNLPRLAARVLASVGDVPLRMVSQAASRRNITFVIRENDLPTALGRVHDRFFAAMSAAQ